jgi:hypothetical protein
MKIHQHVKGRTDMQCRERWVNILDPNINKYVFRLLDHTHLFCSSVVLGQKKRIRNYGKQLTYMEQGIGLPLPMKWDPELIIIVGEDGNILWTVVSWMIS